MLTALLAYFVASAEADVTASSSGVSASGAISDGLFYSIGGGSVVSPSTTRNNMTRLGVNEGWSSDLMCGQLRFKDYGR